MPISAPWPGPPRPPGPPSPTDSRRPDRDAESSGAVRRVVFSAKTGTSSVRRGSVRTGGAPTMTGLAMSERAELQLLAEPDGWRLILRDPDQDGTQGTARDGELEGVRAGGRTPEAAARWLVEQLAAAPETLLGNGFQLRRFGRSVVSPPPGERLITADQTNLSVVVGERLVVKWLRRLEDAEHPAVDTLRHLEQVGFAG